MKPVSASTHPPSSIPPVYAARTEREARLPHPCPRLEASLVWLSQGSRRGFEYVKRGESLGLRLLVLGVAPMTLLFESDEKLSVVRKSAHALNMRDKVTFTRDSLEVLTQKCGSEFDAVLAHYVFDEVFPDEVHRMFENFRSLCAQKGKVLLTLQRSQRRSELVNAGATEIDDGFFEMKDGALAWDVATTAFLTICQRYFSVFSHFEVTDSPSFSGRIFLLTHK